MRVTTRVFSIFLVILIFLCTSCGFIGDQKYDCDVEAVDSIQIVELEKYVDGEYRYEYTVLSEITDYPTFVDKLNNLECSVNWGDPYRLDVGYVVIKVNYTNGDYDLIYSNAQWFHRSGVNQDGFFCFEKEQFNALISDYLGTEDI